ncbi:MAG: hypothetical protein U9Q33_08575 [Campylobacterota bacterium]|nr:hypothetical protein [Campylobacterota bacterium]
MIRYILSFVFLCTISFAQQSQKAGVDCLLLVDENSIICKYTQIRVDHEKTVTFQWIDPKGEISRSRDMNIPALHGSVYDYRYIKGRSSGKWTFKVIDGEKEYTTNFTIDAQ